MSFDEFFEYHKIIEVFQVTERRPDTIQKSKHINILFVTPLSFSQIFIKFREIVINIT
jgi:hypothetical protein